MFRYTLTVLFALLPLQANADKIAQWEGVFERSSQTIKTGEWLGIGGGIAVATGAGMLLAGGASTVSSFSSGESNGSAAGVAVGGAAVGVVGYTVFAVGPAVMAGGTIRQSRAIRKLNPSAPFPWLGTTSWALWGLGLPSTFANPFAAVLLHSGAYVTAGLQKGKNMMYWDARAKAAMAQDDSNRIVVSLTPVSTPQFNGLVLHGAF
jgi:hypothetical protein